MSFDVAVKYRSRAGELAITYLLYRNIGLKVKIFKKHELFEY
jgi:hypothetical protein